MKAFTVETHDRVEFLSITRQVADHVKEAGLTDGVVLAFVPHTTAAVTINENADPDVMRDMKTALGKIAPNLAEFRHGEGNSDAHVRSSLIGCSKTIPVEKGRLALGTWQDIYFCEFDGPRRRHVFLQFLAAMPA